MEQTVYMVLFSLPAILFSFIASILVRKSYSTWINYDNSARLTGLAVGDWLAKSSGLLETRFSASAERLEDRFDPGGNLVLLSSEIANQASIASMAIVAHELGHAQQFADHSLFHSFRSFAEPAASIGPGAAYVLIVVGIVLEETGLTWIGVVLFGFALVIMLLTLPMEMDANRRGMTMLRQSGLLKGNDDEKGVREVLKASTFTYVAAAVTFFILVLQFLRQILPLLLVLKDLKKR